MKRSEFEKGLRELDGALPVDVPADADARIRERLFAKSQPVVRWWVPVAAAAVTLIAVVGALSWPSRPPEPQQVGGFQLRPAPGQHAMVTPAGTVKTNDSATLVDVAQQAELQLGTHAEVSRSSAGARVHRGKVRFDVVHTGKRASTYQVEVSGGVIEVLGTAFFIEQREADGSVLLEHGSIRFRATDGREVMVAPGETLEWPLPAVVETPAPVPEPERKAPAPREPAVLSSEAALEKVAALRTRGRYEEAVAVLNRTLQQPGLTADSRERLRFEVGSILSNQLHDKARACAWWAAHPSPRYAVEITASVQLLGCEKK